ncbi:hypothetical protein ACWC3Y_11170 [Streptomyces sp. NPDC001296]
MSARNESTSLDFIVFRAALASMRNLLAEHIAEVLTKAEDAEHHRIIRLCRGLDEAGLNIDSLVEGWLESYDASSLDVWQSPSSRRATAPDYDPWSGPAPVVLPEAVQRVLVDQIAEMRVRTGWKPDEMRLRAVRLAGELASAGVDLYAAIDKRAQELKPGTPSLRDEPPF